MKIIEIANLYELGVKGYNRMNGSIVSVEGLSPALRTSVTGGRNEVKILVAKREYDEHGKRSVSHKISDIAPTLLANDKQGDTQPLVYEPIAWGGLQEHQTPRADGICPTLTAAAGMGGGHTVTVLEPVIAASRGRGEGWKQCLEVSGDISNALTTTQTDNLVVEAHGMNVGKSPEYTKGLYHDLSRTLDTNGHQGAYIDGRVRKLSAREYFRLMDFDDEDFDKAKAAGLSDHQLYKQAGNSCVVRVVEAIFGTMVKREEN